MSVYQSAPALEQAAITAKDFNFWYGDFHALTGLDLNIAKNAITSFIGPSGCGKSTFLRCINRMNDLIEGTRVVFFKQKTAYESLPCFLDIFQS